MWSGSYSQTRPDALSSILVSDRKTQRYFLFDDAMRLVGWTNLATGEVRAPTGTSTPESSGNMLSQASTASLAEYSKSLTRMAGATVSL